MCVQSVEVRLSESVNLRQWWSKYINYFLNRFPLRHNRSIITITIFYIAAMGTSHILRFLQQSETTLHNKQMKQMAKQISKTYEIGANT